VHVVQKVGIYRPLSAAYAEQSPPTTWRRWSELHP